MKSLLNYVIGVTLQIVYTTLLVQGDYVGFNIVNGKKLSYSQAEPERPAAWL